MQPTTSPQTPCEADSPPTNDVIREPRHIHQMLEQLLVAIIISIAFFELEYSTTFWSRQAFTTANFQNMKVIFWDVMIHEPGPEIKGVRNRFSSDFRLRDDNPPTVLCFGKPKEKEEEEEEEETRIQPIHMPFMNSSRPKKWDVWQKVRENLLSHWPNDVPPSILRHSGHFKHDWGFVKGAHLVYSEISDARGVPEQIFWKHRTTTGFTSQYWSNPNFKHEQISGRTWLLCTQKPVICFSLIALVFTQLAGGDDDDDRTHDMAQCVMSFIRRYAGPLPTVPWTRWCYANGNEAHLQFHIRYPSLSSTPVTQTPDTEGYYLCRDNIPTPEYPGFKNQYIIEERVSIAITTSLRLVTPCYTLVTLADCPKLLDGTVVEDCLQQSQLADLCGELTGVTVFQSIIYQVIEKWAQAWMSVLDHFSLKIARLPNTQLSNSTILKSWSKWIEEMSKDLHSLELDALTSLNNHDVFGVVKKNWEDVLDYQESLSQELQDRIRIIRS